MLSFSFLFLFLLPFCSPLSFSFTLSPGVLYPWTFFNVTVSLTGTLVKGVLDANAPVIGLFGNQNSIGLMSNGSMSNGGNGTSSTNSTNTANSSTVIQPMLVWYQYVAGSMCGMGQVGQGNESFGTGTAIMVECGGITVGMPFGNISGTSFIVTVPGGVLMPGMYSMTVNTSAKGMVQTYGQVKVKQLNFTISVPPVLGVTVKAVNVGSNAGIKQVMTATGSNQSVNVTQLSFPLHTNDSVQFTLTLTNGISGLQPLVLITSMSFNEMGFSVPTVSSPLFPSLQGIVFGNQTIFVPSFLNQTRVYATCLYASYSTSIINCNASLSNLTYSLLSVRVIYGIPSSRFIALKMMSPSVVNTPNILVNYAIGNFSNSLFAVASPLFSCPSISFTPASMRLFVNQLIGNSFAPFSVSNGLVNVQGVVISSEPVFINGIFGSGINFTVAFSGNNFFQYCDIIFVNATSLICNTRGLPPTISTAMFLEMVAVYGNVIANSTDTYSYPIQPVVTSISGCNGTSDTGTFYCATSASTILTLTGSGFLVGISIFVGSYSCAVDTGVTFTFTSLVCLLPPGTGLSLAVVAQYRTVSFTAPSSVTVSYSPPMIYSLDGCLNSTLSGLVKCPRTGGSAITLYGFGLSAPSISVFVGGVACSVFNFAGSDTNVSCILPAGFQQSAPIIVLLSTGPSTSPLLSISYEPCPPGFYPNSTNLVNCVACPAGTFSSDGSACVSCPTGSFSSSTSTTSCTVCPAGTQQVGLSCLACDAGSYSLQPGSLSCDTCSKGLYSAIGASTCTACPTSSRPNGAVCICEAGFYLSTVEFMPNSSCVSCPSGAECSQPNQTIASVASLSGWWRDTNSHTPTFYVCPYGNDACTSSATGTCQNGYAGTVCGICAEGYYMAASICVRMIFLRFLCNCSVQWECSVEFWSHHFFRINHNCCAWFSR